MNAFPRSNLFFLQILLGAFAVLSLPPPLSSAKDPLPQFDRYSTSDGLSNNWVKCILQDEAGFLWFGTKDGLNRYDAYDFKTYSFDASNSRSLRNNTINFLQADPSGGFWIGTSGGVERFDPTSESFELIEALPRYDSLSASLSPTGIWIGTAEGLFHYAKDTGEVRSFLQQTDDPQTLADHMCRALLTDSNGNLWVGTDKALSRVDPQSNGIQNIMLGSQGLAGSHIHALEQDERGYLWVATEKGGLLRSQAPLSPTSIPSFEKILSGNILSLAFESPYSLWVGHRSARGIQILDIDPETNSILTKKRISNDPNNPASLGDNAIHAIYRDKVGDIWVGSYAKGISHYSKQRKPFHVFKHSNEDANSIPDDTVNALAADESRIWVATDKGLAYLDRNDAAWHRFPSLANHPSSPGTNGLYALHHDSSGTLWVGGWDEGLNRYDPESNTFQKFRSGAPTGQSINNDNVFAIADDRQGSLWIGTIGGGLNRYDYATGTFTYFTQDLEKEGYLHDNYVNAILVTRTGELWVSTYNTLNRFDYQTETFQHFTRQTYQGAGMSNADLLDIFEDSRGALWLATEGGLIRFDPQTETFSQYNQTNGLQLNTINAVEEDNSGNLWLSTNRGILKFANGIDAPANPQFRLYDSTEGLPGNQFLPRSSLQDSDGELYFGGTFGIAHFLPTLIKDNQNKPSIALTELQLFNRPVDPLEPDSPLETSLNTSEKITLSSEHSVVSIQYAALSYPNSDKNQYRYRLKGFEDKWNDVGNRRTATYTQLPAGQYTFLVDATNNDGLWSSSPRSLQIRVLPPWWQSIWFNSILSIFLIVAIYSIYHFRVRSLRRQKRQLEEEVQERTHKLATANYTLAESKEEIQRQNAELANHRNILEDLVKERTAKMEAALLLAEDSERLKSAFLANVSHEIRTPMNAIVGFSSLLDDSNVTDDERTEYVELIRGNADVLIAIIDDIVEVSRIEAKQISSQRRPFDLDLKLDELAQFFKAESRSRITINFLNQNLDSPTIIETDELLFGQIMTSLIGNAIKYTKHGSVDFGYQIDGQNIVLYVSDTGIGIPKEEHEKIFDRFYKVTQKVSELYRGLGLGLSITKSLVNLLDGEIWLKSKPGSGSTFYVKLPHKKTDSPNRPQPDLPND